MFFGKLLPPFQLLLYYFCDNLNGKAKRIRTLNFVMDTSIIVLFKKDKTQYGKKIFVYGVIQQRSFLPKPKCACWK